MSETAEFIAGKIKAIRSYRGLSQRSVAEALNVSLRTYQGWEKDFTSSVDNLIKICRVFEVEPLGFLEPLLYHNTLIPEHIDIGNVTSPPEPSVYYKYEILNRAMDGEGNDEIAYWLEKAYPNIIAPITDLDRFIDNCILDIYHLNHSYFSKKHLNRSREKEEALSSLLDIRLDNVIVVTSGHIKQQFLREALLAPYGAEWIISWIKAKPGFRLGISNGFTVSKILDAIPRGAIRNLSLFPMNLTNTEVDFPISATALISSFLYRHTGYQVSTDTMYEKQVFGSFLLADAALLGIGSFSNQGLYERMIRSVLGERTVTNIRRKGIIGDLNYHLLDKSGNQAEFANIVGAIGDENTEALVKAISLDILKEKADRDARIIIAASGVHKAEITKIAMKEGYGNHIITDETIADRLL